WSEDGWLRTEDGQGMPHSETPAPTLEPYVFPEKPGREDFDGPELPPDFQWLRSPWPEELFSLKERPGFLRLFGRESLGSLYRQSLVARRQQSHCYSASTAVDFEPDRFQQTAGLVCYYNGSKYHYLHISHDEEIGKHIRVMSCLPDQAQADVFSKPIAIEGNKTVYLRVEVDRERLLFAFRTAGADPQWHWIPEQFDASALADEAGPQWNPNFTGAFVGMFCQDLSGARRAADFDYFCYGGRGYRPRPE
ncbi:MAG: glycoside hydrolase 43 family protein, partial [Acidobacteria bacterium]|nr:glycoside hydrolase 43 family protein [Acidobacteriota bacterium]